MVQELNGSNGEMNGCTRETLNIEFSVDPDVVGDKRDYILHSQMKNRLSKWKKSRGETESSECQQFRRMMEPHRAGHNPKRAAKAGPKAPPPGLKAS